MFLEECRLLFKRKKILFLYIMYCIIVSIFLCGVIISVNDGLTEINHVNYHYIVMTSFRMIEVDKASFIFFLILSFLYYTESFSEGISETIRSTRTGEIQAAFSKLFVLFILNVISTSILLGINITYVLIVKCSIEVDYLFFLIEIWLLYHLFPGCLAELIGLAIAKIKRKNIKIIFLVLIAYIFCGNFVQTIHFMSQKYEFIYQLADIFCIFSRGTRRAPNLYYLISTEYNNYFRIITWIILCYFLIQLQFKENNWKRKSAFALGIGFFVFFLYIQSFGGAYFDNHLSTMDEWNEPQYYYMNHDVKAETAKFKVDEYVMDLYINRNLVADVLMTIDNPKLDYYTFTLYHGYEIKEITDGEGTILPYERDGDYISIENTKESLEKIRIKYSGYSKHYYSTSQGINLPAYFAYYPISGYYPIFSAEKDFNTFEKTYESYFYIQLNTAEKVFCSLPELQENCWAGYARGVTFLGSRFARCYEESGCRIIYSALEHKESEVIELYDSLSEEGLQNLGDITIFLMPYTMYRDYYAEEGMLLTFDYLVKENFQHYIIDINKDIEEKTNFD